MERLAEVMGHSSVIVTHRYAHLRPELFQEADLDRLSIDLAPKKGDVVSIPPPAARQKKKKRDAQSGAVGYAVATERKRKKTRSAKT